MNEKDFKVALATESIQTAPISINEVCDMLKVMKEAGNIVDQFKKAYFYRGVTQPVFGPLVELPEETSRLLHAITGLFTEAGELAESLLNSLNEKQPIDWINIAEEIGDIEWYQLIVDELLQAHSLSIDEARARVYRKLKARYGDKFDAYLAVNRDLQNERKILEDK